MVLTVDDARKVATRVIIKVRDALPEGFLASYPILQDPGRIFRILPPGLFEIAFNKHVGFFNGVLRCQINVAHVDAFVSPDPSHVTRQIFIKIGGDETYGVLYHEFIHWLSHSDFYPGFYRKGGKAPGVVEGTTEYFTRKLVPSINRHFYQSEYEAIKQIAHLQDSMYKAVFRGNQNAMTEIIGQYTGP
jgi:hypothetical protein